MGVGTYDLYSNLTGLHVIEHTMHIAGTYTYAIPKGSFMLISLQTSTTASAPTYTVSRYNDYVCIQNLAGERNDSKVEVDGTNVKITLSYVTFVTILQVQ